MLFDNWSSCLINDTLFYHILFYCQIGLYLKKVHGGSLFYIEIGDFLLGGLTCSRLLCWSDNYHVVRIKSTWSYLHLKEAMVKNKHKSDHFYAHVVYRHHYYHHNDQYWRNQQQQIPSNSRSSKSISSGFGAILGVFMLENSKVTESIFFWLSPGTEGLPL